MTDEHPTVKVSRRREGANQTLVLHVIHRGLESNHVLPASGEVTVGRRSGCDIIIAHPSVSRRHAVLRIGEIIDIEDLGSANGTRLRGHVLQPGMRLTVAPGEPVELGVVLVVLQIWPAGGAAPERRAIPVAAGDSVPPPAAGPAADLYRLAERVAAGTINVLITGETGVGKEVLAEFVHRRSARAERPFLRLNCAAFSGTLLESELFGHERGAFTGAQAAKPGLLEVAEGGTVFLDEVGELPPEVQAKLLRVVEDRTVRRVGGVKPRPVDVRFIAATNRDIQGDVDRGRFRADLYYRLNGVTLRVPPLRERGEDFDRLVDDLLAQASQRSARPPLRLDPALREKLRSHRWPGNIRELRNVLERAVLVAAGDTIRVEDVSDDVTAPTVIDVETPATVPAEEDAIRVALARTAGNQTEAARLLGISRRTLIERIKRLGIPRPRKR